MRLSKLQKYILEECYFSKNNTKLKVDFYCFYSKKDFAKNKKNIQDAIHESLDSLMLKNLIITYGHKTAQKWFINKVKLSKEGKYLARDLIKSRQSKLPIK